MTGTFGLEVEAPGLLLAPLAFGQDQNNDIVFVAKRRDVNVDPIVDDTFLIAAIP
jgi:hypothetical protein